MVKRLKNPAFLLGAASLVYHLLSQYIKLDESTFKTAVDLLTYLFIGSGIYTSFHSDEDEK
ncbi:hypothetical protein ABEX78_32360 [Priestia megaterium]